MGAPRSVDGIAPQHRRNLPRQRKNLRLELRPSAYASLLGLARENESLVAVIERLIEKAAGCPSGKNEYVHIRA
jgi:hypothetical protein